MVRIGYHASHEILLHNVHRDQETFIGDFASGVLPELDR
jgi:hypothetical protein